MTEDKSDKPPVIDTRKKAEAFGLAAEGKPYKLSAHAFSNWTAKEALHLYDLGWLENVIRDCWANWTEEEHEQFRVRYFSYRLEG